MSLQEENKNQNNLDNLSENIPKTFKYIFYFLLHMISISMLFFSYSTEYVGLLFTIIISTITHFFIINDLLALRNSEMFVLILFFVVIFLFIGNVLVFFFMIRLRNFYMPFINNAHLLSKNVHLDDITKKYINKYEYLLVKTIFLVAFLSIYFVYHLNTHNSSFYDIDVKEYISLLKGTNESGGGDSAKLVTLFLYSLKVMITLVIIYSAIYIAYIGYFFSNRVLSFNNLKTSSESPYQGNSSFDVITIPIINAFNNFNLNYATKAIF